MNRWRSIYLECIDRSWKSRMENSDTSSNSSIVCCVQFCFIFIKEGYDLNRNVDWILWPCMSPNWIIQDSGESIRRPLYYVSQEIIVIHRFCGESWSTLPEKHGIKKICSYLDIKIAPCDTFYLSFENEIISKWLQQTKTLYN